MTIGNQVVPAWTLWLPVITALGVALLGTLGAWWLDVLRSRRAATASQGRQRDEAYEEMIRWSRSLVRRMWALGLTGRFYSGLLGSASVLLDPGSRLSPMKVFDLMNKEYAPLEAAWGRVWLLGSQQAIDAADEIMDAAGEVMEAAGAVLKRGRLSAGYRGIVGERWTEAQEAALWGAIERLARAQAKFAHLVRKETGREPVELAIDRATAERTESQDHDPIARE